LEAWAPGGDEEGRIPKARSQSQRAPQIRIEESPKGAAVEQTLI